MVGWQCHLTCFDKGGFILKKKKVDLSLFDYSGSGLNDFIYCSSTGKCDSDIFL